MADTARNRLTVTHVTVYPITKEVAARIVRTKTRFLQQQNSSTSSKIGMITTFQCGRPAFLRVHISKLSEQTLILLEEDKLHC